MNTSSNPLIRPKTPFERRLVDAVDRAKPTRGVGTFNRPLPGGVSQQTKPQHIASFRGCWYPSIIDSTHIKLTGGTLTCGTIFTPSVSSVSVDASALNYVYLRATLSATTTDGYVTGGSVTAASILSSTSTLTSNNTYGYILLCTWQASALVERYEFYSFFGSLQNQGTGDTLFVYWNS